jgi:hypothetical protein
MKSQNTSLVVVWALVCVATVTYFVAHGQALGGGVQYIFHMRPGAALVEVGLVVGSLCVAVSAYNGSTALRAFCGIVGLLALAFGLSPFLGLPIAPYAIPLGWFGLLLPFGIAIVAIVTVLSRNAPNPAFERTASPPLN